MVSDGSTMARLIKLTKYLCEGGELTSRFIQAEFSVSKATAKRDLVVIECALPVEVCQEKINEGVFPRKVLRLRASPKTTVAA